MNGGLPAALQKPDFDGIRAVQADAVAGDRQPELVDVYDYETARQILCDATMFSSAPFRWFYGPAIGGTALPGLDGDEHRRRRRRLCGWLKADVVEANRELIRQTAQDVLSTLGSEADLMADFAWRLSARVIASVVGLMIEDAQLVSLSHDLLDFAARPKAAIVASRWVRGTVRRQLLEGVPSLRTGERWAEALLDPVVPDEDRPWDDIDDAVTLVRLLVFAGIETTARGLGSVLLGLLSEPLLMDAARASPAFIHRCVEEALRWEAPVRFTPRLATTDTRVGGMLIPGGALVLVHLGVANHDPARFPNPERFDPSRGQGEHLAFGHGRHKCVGLHLARLVMAVGAASVLQRFPAIQPSVDHRELVEGDILRAPATLRIVTG